MHTVWLVQLELVSGLVGSQSSNGSCSGWMRVHRDPAAAAAAAAAAASVNMPLGRPTAVEEVCRSLHSSICGSNIHRRDEDANIPLLLLLLLPPFLLLLLLLLLLVTTANDDVRH
jgi:hypothetical protein